MTPALADADARRQIVENLDDSFLVEAAAGTGKTTVLVNRLVALLRSGRTSVDKVVAVTFTRKAAGELKLRLRQELETALQEAGDPETRGHVQAAIARLEEARVGTIHSFCAEILRERPVEAAIDPDFQELSEDEAPRLFGQIFQAWIQQKLQEMPRALSRAMARISVRASDQLAPLDRLREEAWKVVDRRDFDRTWTRRPLDHETEIEELVQQCVQLAHISSRCPNPKDYLRQDFKPLRGFVEDLERSLLPLDRQTMRGRHWDELEARLCIEVLEGLTRKQRKGRGSFAEGVSRQEVLDMREKLVQSLESFKIRAEADLAAALRATFESVVDQYEEAKRQRGQVDFVDLLEKVRNLVCHHPEVRKHLSSRFTHIFVDEFQDTDPLQVEIILLLAADRNDETNWKDASIVPGKLFLVGDPKQSIYRFRRADIQLYDEVKKVLQKSGVRFAELSTNFRSVQPLQRAINASFEAVFDGDEERVQPRYVPLKSAPSTNVTAISRTGKHPPEIVALPVPEPRVWNGQITHKSFHSSFPDALAAFIKWILDEQPWELRSGDRAEPTPIQARHITILFRRFMSFYEDVTRPYIRALDARGIPHLLVGSRTFHHREEVESLRAALTAVEWPDDELNVFATLRGSFFAVEDGRLLRFRKTVGTLHPFRQLDDTTRESFPEIAQILGLLAELHYQRNHRPIVDTIQRILEFSRAHVGLALRPAGEQVLANVQRVCDLARTFELNGGLSFRGFVDFLLEEAEKPRSADSPVLEEAADGVRLMTLHSAKGLESPVIVLADMTAKIASRNPSQHVNHETRLAALPLLFCQPWELVDNQEVESARDQAEGERIAYVAATRAREMLIVPVVGLGPEYYQEGWIHPLNPAVYPARDNWYSPAPPPDECPSFGDRTAVIPPANRDGLPLPMIKPGLHRPEKGSHRVLWWDPCCLELDVPPGRGLRDEEILIHDERTSDDGWQRYQTWRSQRAARLEKSSEKTISIIRPSDAGLPPPRRYQIKAHRVAEDRDLPMGKRFGALVHTVLRDVPLDATVEQVQTMARLHGRSMRATDVEIDQATRSVHRVLENVLVSAAGSAERCLREHPITYRIKQDQIVEGTIDLAYLNEGTWTLIDFKTTADMEERLTEYETQLEWYALALEETSGYRVEPHLIQV